MKRIYKWIIPLLCGLAVIILFRFILFIGYVPSASMEPAIKKGSYIIGYRIYANIRSGDVVVFRHDGQPHIKRVAAVAGDTVYINDAAHSYAVNEPPETASRVLTVPDGCYFIIGDNLDDSLDSRYWDDPFVSDKDVLAKLF